MKAVQKRPAPVLAWAGFCDGVMHFYRSEDGAPIYRTRRAARANYCDVRRVAITEVQPKTRRRA